MFKLYLLGYALFRFWVEFVRGGDQVRGRPHPAPAVPHPVALLLAAYFARRVAHRPARSPTLTPVTES